MEIRTAKQLHIGDTVCYYNEHSGRTSAFDTMIVKQIESTIITFFRPYGVTANFTYSGGVICYTGIEEIKINIDNSIQFMLLGKSSVLDFGHFLFNFEISF